MPQLVWCEKKQEAIPAEEYEKPQDQLGSMTVYELIEYAKSHNIDIGNATSRAGILKKIEEAGAV